MAVNVGGEPIWEQDLDSTGVHYVPATGAVIGGGVVAVGGTRQLPGYLVSSAFVVAIDQQ